MWTLDSPVSNAWGFMRGIDQAVSNVLAPLNAQVQDQRRLTNRALAGVYFVQSVASAAMWRAGFPLVRYYVNKRLIEHKHLLERNALSNHSAGILHGSDAAFTETLITLRMLEVQRFAYTSDRSERLAMLLGQPFLAAGGAIAIIDAPAADAAHGAARVIATATIWVAAAGMLSLQGWLNLSLQPLLLGSNDVITTTFSKMEPGTSELQKLINRYVRLLQSLLTRRYDALDALIVESSNEIRDILGFSARLHLIRENIDERTNHAVDNVRRCECPAWSLILAQRKLAEKALKPPANATTLSVRAFVGTLETADGSCRPFSLRNALKIRTGDVVHVTGPSGIGKTLLVVSCLVRAARPQAIRPTSFETHRWSWRRQCIQRVQWSQKGTFFEDEPVVAYIGSSDASAYKGLTIAAILGQDTEARRMIYRWGVCKSDDANMDCCSTGERQRICIARFIREHSCAHAWIFDESLSNVDQEMRVLIMREIVECARAAGVTVYFTSHADTETLAEIRTIEVSVRWQETSEGNDAGIEINCFRKQM